MKDFDKTYLFYDYFMKLLKLYKVEEIKKALDLAGHEIILDIGGGTGFLAKHLQDSCKNITVLDESEKMLSKVVPMENVIPLVGNATSTNFEHNSIDVVILSDVLHHIKDQVILLEEIHRILKTDGKLLIMDFEKKRFKIKVLRLFEFLLFGKLFFHTHREVIDLMKNAFNIEKDILNRNYFIIVGRKND
ncbi:MAG: hypothetical protein CVV02_12385 [Firmicutes bacterium HGW-Firmicutes-7]|nr:MAG: hypothetical protein CVV02_12385 [Firmicutes bacterium HGW-Firmicutes-7]